MEELHSNAAVEAASPAEAVYEAVREVAASLAVLELPPVVQAEESMDTQAAGVYRMDSAPGEVQAVELELMARQTPALHPCWCIPPDAAVELVAPPAAEEPHQIAIQLAVAAVFAVQL